LSRTDVPLRGLPPDLAKWDSTNRQHRRRSKVVVWEVVQAALSDIEAFGLRTTGSTILECIRTWKGNGTCPAHGGPSTKVQPRVNAERVAAAFQKSRRQATS
jgi:hypothetical protein